tara:strand:- start:19 stop:792 length:774 start_codon:yes stop_codon:yes gene_type:complete
MYKFYQRLRKEIDYLKCKKWSLQQMGSFWDELDEYDDINSTIYPYEQRFINSKKLFDDLRFENFDPKQCLDIQTRTGNGSIFWNKIFKELDFTIADFSKNFLEKSKRNLIDRNIAYKDFLIKEFPLPFKDNSFDFVLTYETVEHISNYEIFLSEITRVTKKDGIIILTCPNYSWEIVHFIAAVLNINHSEGPHTFIKKKFLDDEIKKNNLKVLNYNTSIFLPFNFKISIFLDKMLNKFTPKFIKEKIFLRHSYILKK